MVKKISLYLKSFTSQLNFGKVSFGEENLKIAEKIISNDSKKEISLRENEVAFRYHVHKETLNYWGAMHGGAISTLIDIASTIAITALDRTNRKNISIELSTNFLAPVTPDKDVFVLCKISKIGKTVAFSTVELIETDHLKTIATASHTKAMLDTIWELKPNNNI